MKNFALLSLIGVIPRVIAGIDIQQNRDLDAARSSIEWHENNVGKRIMDADKRADSPPSTTDVATPTSTISTALLGPSPTTWTDRGCYANDPKGIVLAKDMTPEGDKFLTVAKCQNTCYQASYQYAGVQNGNDCWCSDTLGGNWSTDQTACNITCSGDQKITCGGSNLLSVFEAEVTKSHFSGFNFTSTTGGSNIGPTASPTIIHGQNPHSGAARNKPFQILFSFRF